jgi:EAL domain-containing protein (putative c-di-GMP-specific phosphodiesterase class I)
MPRQFIHLAEESGHIIELGRFVLQRACEDWRRWCERWGIADQGLYVTLNVSGRHLQQGELERDVAGALQQSGLAPRTSSSS